MDAVPKPVCFQHTRVCLCVLCGLPGTGKSTLVLILPEYFRKRHWECWVVSYDELIPDEAYELRKAEMDDLSHGQTNWKVSRRGVLQRLEQLLQRAPDPGCGAGHPPQEPEDSSLCLPRHTATLVILLDDNFYYQSMRYEVYQLARKYSLGFCQLYLRCPVTFCLSRNRARSCPLPDEVIVEMEKRMEPPNPVRNSWEERSLTLSSERALSPQDIELSIGLIAAALDNPLSPIQDDTEQKEADRLVCASNVVHQADQACRRLVSEAMQGARENKVPAQSMKFLALELNQLKMRFLDDLRRQALQGCPTNPSESVDRQGVVSRVVAAFEREKCNCVKRYGTEA